ncbi:MAG: hypothetical protein ACT4PJ_10235 [Gemmatimonadaceae bacterium]
MKLRLPNRVTAVLAAVSIAAAVSACAEEFEGGAACPVLCPESGFEILSDTLEAVVVLDTTLRGYPLPGEENQLTLMQRFGSGDTIITAGIVRFDFIPKTIPVGTNDSTPVVKLDSAVLRVNTVALDTLTNRDTVKQVPVTIEVYDVDTAATDFDTAAVRARFRPETLLGTYTVRRDSLPDTLSILLDTAAVRARVQAGRLRVGLRIRSGESMQVAIRSTEGGGPLFLAFRARSAAGDTLTRTIAPASSSSGTAGDVPALRDYLIVLRGTPPPPPSVLAVGGLPANRAYIRLSIPPRLVDSVTVVRAALVMTQAPVRGRTDDTVRGAVEANISIARAVLDPGRAALLLLSRPGLSDRLLTPQDSGLVRFELAGTIPFWRLTPEDEMPRVIVLRSSREGHFPSEFYFFSNEAPANLRPRIEISYVPRVDFSLP